LTAEEVIRSIANGRPEWAVALRGLRQREDLTQEQLGEKLGVNQGNISNMERGKRSIGKTLAKKIAEYFGVDYRLFL
jgi:transcriptional regulator with XRE-family HTH domain